jgi:protein-tyrosine phosphatase
VLVHCFAGKSRASTITLSYMMTEMHLNLKESFEHLKNKRPIACPNIGFVMQLMGHEKKVFGYNSSLEQLKLDAAKAAKEEQASE